MDTRHAHVVDAAPRARRARVVVELPCRTGNGQPGQQIGTDPHVGPDVHAHDPAVPVDGAVPAASRQVVVISAAPGRETPGTAVVIPGGNQERGIAQHLFQGQRLAARPGPPAGGRHQVGRQVDDRLLRPGGSDPRDNLIHATPDGAESQSPSDLRKDSTVHQFNAPLHVVGDRSHRGIVVQGDPHRIAQFQAELLGGLHHVVSQRRHRDDAAGLPRLEAQRARGRRIVRARQRRPVHRAVADRHHPTAGRIQLHRELGRVAFTHGWRILDRQPRQFVVVGDPRGCRPIRHRRP